MPPEPCERKFPSAMDLCTQLDAERRRRELEAAVEEERRRWSESSRRLRPAEPEGSLDESFEGRFVKEAVPDLGRGRRSDRPARASVAPPPAPREPEEASLETLVRSSRRSCAPRSEPPSSPCSNADADAAGDEATVAAALQPRPTPERPDSSPSGAAPRGPIGPGAALVLGAAVALAVAFHAGGSSIVAPSERPEDGSRRAIRRAADDHVVVVGTPATRNADREIASADLDLPRSEARRPKTARASVKRAPAPAKSMSGSERSATASDWVPESTENIDPRNTNAIVVADADRQETAAEMASAVEPARSGAASRRSHEPGTTEAAPTRTPSPVLPTFESEPNDTLEDMIDEVAQPAHPAVAPADLAVHLPALPSPSELRPQSALRPRSPAVVPPSPR